MEEEIKGILYILKEHILDDNALSCNYKEPLDDLISLTIDDPALLFYLYKWDFLNHQLPYLIREPKTLSKGLDLGIRILRIKETQVPKFYTTKSFVFYLTEMLYCLLKNRRGISKLLDFVSILILKQDNVLDMCYECGFFVLINAIASKATSRLYSEIFHNKVESISCSFSKPIRGECLYEIQRKQFSSEVLFKEDKIIRLKIPATQFVQGSSVYKRIFDDLHKTSFYELLKLGIEPNLNLLNYGSWSYIILLERDELLSLVNENNYLGVRLYKLVLRQLYSLKDRSEYSEVIKSKSLISHVSKMLECKNTLLRKEYADIMFFYFLLVDEYENKIISEKRVRLIFELLEFECDCEGITDDYNRYDTQIRGEKTFENNLQSNLTQVYASGDAFKDLSSEQLEKKPKLTSSCYVSAYTEINSNVCLKENNNDLVYEINCFKFRMIQLLEYFYYRSDKRYFYKPTYLILLRETQKHLSVTVDFIDLVYKDILLLLKSNLYNLARIIFPYRSKKVVGRITDGKCNELIEDEYHAVDDSNVNANDNVMKDESLNTCDGLSVFKRLRDTYVSRTEMSKNNNCDRESPTPENGKKNESFVVSSDESGYK